MSAVTIADKYSGKEVGAIYNIVAIVEYTVSVSNEQKFKKISRRTIRTI